MDFLQAASTPIDYLLEDDQNRASSVYPGLDKYAAGGVGDQTDCEIVSAYRSRVYPLFSILHCLRSGGAPYTNTPWGQGPSAILLTYLQAEASSSASSIFCLRYASSRRRR